MLFSLQKKRDILAATRVTCLLLTCGVVGHMPLLIFRPPNKMSLFMMVSCLSRRGMDLRGITYTLYSHVAWVLCQLMHEPNCTLPIPPHPTHVVHTMCSLGEGCVCVCVCAHLHWTLKTTLKGGVVWCLVNLAVVNLAVGNLAEAPGFCM